MAIGHTAGLVNATEHVYNVSTNTRSFTYLWERAIAPDKPKARLGWTSQ